MYSSVEFFLCLHLCNHHLDPGIDAFSRRHLCPFPVRPPTYQARYTFPVPLYTILGPSCWVRKYLLCEVGQSASPHTTALTSDTSCKVQGSPDTLRLDNSQEELTEPAESDYTHSYGVLQGTDTNGTVQGRDT